MQHTCTNNACEAVWTSLKSGSTETLTAVWGSGPGDVYVTGTNYTMLHSTDGGQTWTAQLNIGATTELDGLWGSGPNDVYAAGANPNTLGQHPLVLHSINSGIFWATEGVPLLQITPDNPTNFASIWGSGASDVYVVGSNYVVAPAIIHSTDAGQTWNPQTAPVQSPLLGVWGSAMNDVYAVGENGTILHTVDSGQTWTQQTSGVTNLLYTVWGSGPSDVYIVGDVILHSSDGGQTWIKQPDPTQLYRLRGIWGSSAGDVYAVGEDLSVFGVPLIIHTANGGASWEAQQTNYGAGSLNGIWGSAPGDIYAVGDGGIIIHLP
jgi:photosystem II stability/assembly factor-like uncharacterized protein